MFGGEQVVAGGIGAARATVGARQRQLRRTGTGADWGITGLLCVSPARALWVKFVACPLSPQSLSLTLGVYGRDW